MDPAAVGNAARVLRSGKKVLVLLSGRGVPGKAQALAWRIGQASGAAIKADFLAAHLARGRGQMQLERVPYHSDSAIAALRHFEHIILVNAKAPVGFFAYPGKPSTQYPSGAQLHVLSRPDQDAQQALAALAQALGAPESAIPDPCPRPVAATGAPTPEGLAQTLQR